MYSDLNYTSVKQLKAVFGLTHMDFVKQVNNGKIRLKRKYKNPLVYVDSIGTLYEDRENVVMKMWTYDFEPPKEKYYKMLDSMLKGFPRCFFRVSDDVPEGYYRVFHKGTSYKLCVYVFEGFARCVCFSREHEEELMLLYKAFEEGRVDIEG